MNINKHLEHMGVCNLHHDKEGFLPYCKHRYCGDCIFNSIALCVHSDQQRLMDRLRSINAASN